MKSFFAAEFAKKNTEETRLEGGEEGRSGDETIARKIIKFSQEYDEKSHHFLRKKRVTPP